MKTVLSTPPRFLIFFFRLSALIGLVPFLVNTVDILLHASAPSLTPSMSTGMRLLMGVIAAPLTLVIAALCIRRAADNLIGWQLVAFSFGTSVQVMRADLLPAAAEVMIANLLISQFWFAFLLIPLYFPDGRLYPARFNRWGNPLIGFMIVFSIVSSSFFSRQFSWGAGSSRISVPNPLFVIDWDYRMITLPMIFLLLAAGILVVILRYRGSKEQERLQLRWLLFGVVFQVGITFLISFLKQLGFDFGSNLVILLYSLIIPSAIGIAVLRYRLYDIDIIIRRTLVYGLLTFLLGLVYFGLIVLLQQAFRTLTGQASPLAVVISTLVIYALFQPLRRRIQTVIDRRFFRSRYNSEHALERFSANLRERVDLPEIEGELVGVVSETIQPVNVSLWMREMEKK